MRKKAWIYLILFVFSPFVAVATCTDEDLDGYGFPGDPSCPNGAAEDCNDFDPATYPGAVEVCFGLDSNCDGLPDQGAGLPNADGDQLGDGCDNCPLVANDTQSNRDFDPWGDVCDNCPLFANDDQTDADGDGQGDACDRVLAVTRVEVSDSGGGDGDGYADAGETVTLDLTVWNLGSTDLHGLKVEIATSSSAIACVRDAQAIFGTVPAGTEATNPATDRYEIIVSQDVSAQTLSLAEVKQAVFAAVATANEIPVPTTAGAFTLSLDLDVLGDPTGGGPLNGTGTLTENFDSIAGTPGLTSTFGRTGLSLADVIAVVPGVNCLATPLGPPDCSVNTSANDWHLHDFAAEPSNAPDGGWAHSGLGSLHLARHLSPTDPDQTSYRFRQLAAFYGPPINLGFSGERALEMWIIAMMADDNSINFNTGEAGDIATVQIRLDEDSSPAVDGWGAWQRIEPVFNPYDHGRDSLFSSACKFDPTDDFFDDSGGGVADETMCPPNRGWSNMGERIGSDNLTCTDSNGNFLFDCGLANQTGCDDDNPATPPSATCFTDVGSVGTGVWVRTRFDLGALAGRRAQVRLLFGSLAFGDPTFLSYLETPESPGAFNLQERDDGWLVDDIKFTGLLSDPLNLVADGGDDQQMGTSVICGANAVAETRAEGDDVQALGVGDLCGSPADVVVTAGLNGVLDSVGSSVPTSDPDVCDGLDNDCDGVTDEGLGTTTCAEDPIPPVITIDSPGSGAIYLLNQVVPADYSCTDGESGITSCTGTVPSGTAIDTSTVGSHVFTVTALDGAGNSAVATMSYAVQYQFTGFLPPVDNPPTNNVVTAGRTIPVKWQLTDAAGAYLTSLSTVTSVVSSQVVCDAAPTDVIPDNATTISPESLAYDALANQFVFSWQTSKGWKNTCRQLWLTLADGTIRTAKFKLK